MLWNDSSCYVFFENENWANNYGGREKNAENSSQDYMTAM